jgi:cyclic-di-GMP-binding protein
MPLHLSLPQSGAGVALENSVAPEAFADWVAKLAVDDPLRAGRALAEQLEALNAQRVRITLRQDLNEVCFPVVQSLLARLERDLGAGQIPLPPASRAVAKTAEDLIVQLALSYKSLLVEQSRRLFGFASSGRALLPIQRTMLLLGQRLVLAYRVYQTPPKGVWTELHELYQFAARRGLSQRDVDGASPTPLALYKAALLVAFADPQRLMHGDLDVVMHLVHQCGERAQIGVAQERRNATGVFVIKPGRDVAGYAVSKRHNPEPQHHDLVLNTLPVAEAIGERLAKLTGGATCVEAGLPVGADSVRAKELLVRLVKQWGTAPNRRHNRLRTHAKVEINVGLAEIWDFLNGHSTPPAGDAPSVALGEWLVTNESRNGFALMHVAGPMAAVRVGEVVGLRVRDTPSYHVCVVRWVLSDNPEHVELGLEEMAPAARPANIRRMCDEVSKSVQALLLPEVPEQGKAPSIVAPVGALDSTCELSVGELQAKLRVRPTETVERTPSMQLLHFNSVS